MDIKTLLFAILLGALAFLLSAASEADDSSTSVNTVVLKNTANGLYRKNESGEWLKSEPAYIEYDLPVKFIIHNEGGLGVARLDLEDPGQANEIYAQAAKDDGPVVKTDLFEGWEYEQKLEVDVKAYRDRELASSKVSVIVTTPVHILSQGCNPDDVFYIEGFGNATSPRMPSKAEAEAMAQIKARAIALGRRDAREGLLKCNEGCTLTRGPFDDWNTAPVSWQSKKIVIDNGDPFPPFAWWAKTFFGWRAMYLCKK